MRLDVKHTTTYAFDTPKRSVTQSLRLWPSQFEGQIVVDWSVDVPGGVHNKVHAPNLIPLGGITRK